MISMKTDLHASTEKCHYFSDAPFTALLDAPDPSIENDGARCCYIALIKLLVCSALCFGAKWCTVIKCVHLIAAALYRLNVSTTHVDIFSYDFIDSSLYRRRNAFFRDARVMLKKRSKDTLKHIVKCCGLEND
jgi:hypothetical protein